MMYKKDWQYLIWVIRKIALSSGREREKKRYYAIVDFLEKKGVKVEDLDTQL